MSIKDMVNSMLKENSIQSGILSFGKSQEEIVNEGDIRLAPSALRTLIVAHIAEQMMTEGVEDDSELEKFGLMEAKKLTQKGKDYIKQFLPTIYAS